MSDEPRKKRVRRSLHSDNRKSQRNAPTSSRPAMRKIMKRKIVKKSISVSTKRKKEIPTTSRQTRRLKHPSRKSSKKTPSDSKPSKMQHSKEETVGEYRNLTHYLCSTTRVYPYQNKSSQIFSGPLIRCWSNLVPRKLNYKGSTYCPLKRAVCDIATHPTNSDFVVAGSKGGELVLYDMKKNGDIKWLTAPYTDSSITALQFHPHQQSSIYFAALHGKVIHQDFHGQEKILLNTFCWSNWFCSLKVIPDEKLLLAGDTAGNLHMLPENEENVLLKTKIHESKVTSIDFSPRVPHLFVTSSSDKSVKLWDLRMMSKEPHPLHSIAHNFGVNSACFSPSSGNLLTTDQRSEFKVFSGPYWNHNVTFPHPSWNSQYFSSNSIPVKSSWHPLFDVIVVGWYSENPDFSGKQAIYFLDGHIGNELFTLETEYPIPFPMVNVFNCTGDTLVTGSGNSVTLWKDKEVSSKFRTVQPRSKCTKCQRKSKFKHRAMHLPRPSDT